MRTTAPTWRAAGKTWTQAGRPVDPFAAFAKAGCTAARIRVWVGDEGTNRLNYAIKTARRAQAAGLRPYVVLFLSEEWADYVKQPSPKILAEPLRCRQSSGY